MFLQACLNGSRPPGDHEALPLTPDELARDAREVAEAGAVAVHVHPRGPDGRESLEAEHCGAAVAALREAAPKLEISLSTGLWITDGDVERRLACVDAWTELPDTRLAQRQRGGVGAAGGPARRARGLDRDRPLERRPSRPARRLRAWRAAAGARSSSRRRRRRPSPSPPPARSTAGSSARGSSSRSCTMGSTSRRGPCSTPPCAASARSAIGFEDSYSLPDARRAGSNAELVAAAAARYRQPIRLTASSAATL